MSQNPWIKFLKANGGKGMTIAELKAKYKNKEKVNCRKKLSKKISVNMREYKQGRWKSPKQAIAVSYSQVRRSHPRCIKKL